MGSFSQNILERFWSIENQINNTTQAMNLKLDELSNRIARSDEALDRKVERIWGNIEFIKNHLSSYLGQGIALTYLVDETPIYVNANDFGGPANYISGGEYETENLAVLESFVRPDTVFLDIGANLGFFTLKIAKRLGAAGRVHAFEPHPFLYDLMGRSVFLNGVSGRVVLHKLGLSDHDAAVEFQYPVGHLGGGGIGHGDADRFTTIKSEVRRLDELLGPSFVADLVKIDVEGHEGQVFRGMRGIIARSPDIKILFEKLQPRAGNEAEIAAFFDGLGLLLYGVDSSSRLELMSGDELAGWSGYVLAAHPGAVQESNRAFFKVYPAQLHTQYPIDIPPPGHACRFMAANHGLLFHGPYWFLRRGTWSLRINGAVKGNLRVSITERFGRPASDLEFGPNALTRQFATDHDLVFFECAARADGDETWVDLVDLEFTRLG